MTEEYYIKELCKLVVIIEQIKGDTENKSKLNIPQLDYFQEKTQRILDQIPIQIHPTLKYSVYRKLLKYSPTLSVIDTLTDPRENVLKEGNDMRSTYDTYEQTINESMTKQK